MKKIFYLVALCFTITVVESQAQLLEFGVKGGVNFPSLNSTDNSADWDSKNGWHAGLMAKVNIPIVNIQGEVLFSHASFTLPDMEDFKNTTLAIPITAQLLLLDVFTIHAGPQFKYAVSQKLGDVDFQDQIEENTVSFVAGAGVMLGKLDFHFRFIFPSKLNINLGTITNEYKSSDWQLSLGYWFGEE